MQTASTQMSYGGHVKALLILGLPLIGGHLGQTAISITDVVMLGWYGVEALAAVTLGGTYFHMFFLVGSGFAWAVMPMVAAFQAEADQTGVRRATRMGLWISLMFGAISLPFLVFAEPILLLLRQRPEVAADAAAYLRIAGWGLVPGLGVMVIKSYLAALERTQPILWIILAAAVVNGVFNWAFIFGNWGAPELGLVGAAWASNVTQVAMFLGVVIYARFVLPEHDLFARLWRVDRQMLARVIKLGLPIGLTTLSEAGLFSASALMMGTLGKVTLAAHGIVVMLASITFMVHMGLSNAATVRAGNAVGRRDPDHLARGAVTAFVLSLVFSAFTIGIFLLLPEALINIFLSRDEAARPDIMQIGIVLLAIAALFQLVDGAQVIWLGLLRGVQDTTVPMVMAAISYWPVGLGTSYVLGFVLGWGAPGIWLGLVFGLSCAAVLLGVRFWRVALPTLRR
ncbi:MAG: MATE family efflux transporter [Pseudomonadota bacterium]